MEETDISLDKSKKELLEKLRNERRNEDNRGHSTSSGDKVQGTYGPDEGYSRGNTDTERTTFGGAQGGSTNERTVRGTHQGDGSPVPANEHTPQSYSTDGQRPTGAIIEPLITEFDRDNNDVTQRDKDRERELARQRQERYRERQKQAQNTSVTSQNKISIEDKPKFILKNPFGKGSVTQTAVTVPQQKVTEPVKLITNKEAEELLEDLTFIYQKGASLLDDLIEVVVKDHEEVNIWELEEEEARMLAKMHLERAKVDRGAAQAARKLVGLHDKMFLFMMLVPRAVATGKHVIEHEGLSFK